MERKSWTWIDKSTWGVGPWTVEPDKLQWSDPATGLPCLARRSPRMGNWCGYVGVAPGHPLHGLGYGDLDLDVHGGLTFAGGCDVEDPEHGICHRPAPGEPEEVWWFGFDLGHAFDVAPAMDAYLRSMPGLTSSETLYAGYPGRRPVYRTLAYVQEQCAHLAAQLAGRCSG
jgi:hypothetical protein